MKSKRKFKRAAGVVFREEDDMGLLFDPDTGKINVLNETGKFIWSCLESGKTGAEMVEALESSFDIADRKKAEAEVRSFIEMLGSSGLLEDYVPFANFPRSVCFAITSKCNLNCKHCLNRNIPASEPDMTTEELEGIIDQLADGGIKGLSVFGGEPLCHPDFKRIVGRISRHKISISLNTNGTLIDDEMARWLRANNVGGTVVSFDGASAAVMDGIRGAGVFEKCLEGIAALRKEKIAVLLSVTLTKLNYKDVKDMVVLGKEIGGSAIRFNHIFYGGNAVCFVKELYLSPDEEREAIEAVCKAREEFGEFVSSESSYLCQKKKLERVKDYKGASDRIVVGPCGAAVGKCAIRADGWVVPCEILWSVKSGNLREEKLAEIWEGSDVLDRFRKPLVLDLEDMPECKGCSYQYMCFLGHRCYPYHNPGGVANRELYCWLKKL